MAHFPKDLRYTPDHEWLRVDKDGNATVGITDHAQEALGDIVFVELPEVGTHLDAHEVLGVVESVKTTSDVYMPVGGTVIEVNGDLTGSPAVVNEAPYTQGWLIRINMDDLSEANGLLDADNYGHRVAELDH